MLGQLWPRESGSALSRSRSTPGGSARARSSSTPRSPTRSRSRRSARRPAAARSACSCASRSAWSGAIIPWNAPVALICHKIGPALLAGCTVVLKSSPEAPGEGYVFAEVAEQIGLPPGVLNVVTADREVSELLVTNPGVDKITFTGSTAAGRRIASLCGERIARCTLELGGKSAAVVLDDMDLGTAAKTLARAECGAQRPGVLVAHPHHRDHGAATTSSSTRSPRASAQDASSATRSTSRVAARAARVRTPARPGRGLHRQGRRRGRDARDRRRPPGGPRPRLLRRADGVRQRRQPLDDRPRGDLRPGADASSPPTTSRTRCGSPTTPSTG